jgi:hypothetical protein
MNRAERRQQAKGKAKAPDGAPQHLQARQVPGQARPRTERGLVRHVSQSKGRRS